MLEIHGANINSGQNLLYSSSSATFTVNKLNLVGCRFAGTVEMVQHTSGTIGELTFRDCIGTFSAVTGRAYRGNGGSLGTLKFMGGTYSNGNTLAQSDSSSGALTCILAGCSATGFSRIFNAYAAAVLILDYPTLASVLQAFYTNGGPLTVKGAMHTTGSWTSLLRNASEVVEVIGQTLPFDTAMLTQTNGDACYNTNAASPPFVVGPAVSDGTTWRNANTGAAKTGTATLAAGTVTVADTRITANSVIRLSQKTAGGTPGALFVSAKVAGTSFTITSTNAADTSVVQYDVVTY
jgi:hypothetical protein